VIPLIRFTGDRARMGSFASPATVRTLAWVIATIIVSLNVWLVYETVGEWLASAGDWRGLLLLLVAPVAAFLIGLLLYVTLEPVLPNALRRGTRVAPMPEAVADDLPTPVYQRILVPLDHTAWDRAAIAHAAALAKTHGARLYLLHVEEDVTSQVYGAIASTAEVRAGQAYLTGIVDRLTSEGIEVETVVRHAGTPRREIVEAAKKIEPDLLVMGAHGHRGLKSLLFGATINAVRHAVQAPVLVVRNQSTSKP
jgi:manganese transport protein